ncbi:MAG: glycosyltransferase [Ignavibacteria bacterium]|nr:glycosyltransferase [Ignavibacteria bacterium]MBK7445876.1 glycosyltransferase [Ignavibacteria bacterium]
MIKQIKVVHIISNLSLGGAQILLFDILCKLKEYEDLELTLVTIDSGEYIEKYKNAGIKVIDLGEKGLVNPKIYFKLKKILESLKPDIVHTHLNKADFYGRIAAKRSNVPLIISTCHNYSTTHSGADINKKSFFDVIDNFVIDYSKSYLIAISKLVKQYLINRNPSYEKITEVIYNGINFDKIKYKLSNGEILKLRSENNIDSDDFVISVIGRLDKQKGHLIFLESVKEIIHQNKKIKILLIGDGSLREQIEIFIKENNLSSQVIMKGFQPDSEPYIEISDLICVPSLWEGFGLVIIEGMIKRKIILASDVGGIPEIIEDGKTGFLFDPQNKTELIKKIIYIYHNIKELDHIKEKAVSVIKNNFDINKNTGQYYNSYMSKIGKLKIQ